MADIVNYAYERGVRVVVEFDVPGHAYSWGMGYPTIRAQCPPSYAANINNYPLDPSQNLTFQVIQGLFQEMAAIFPEQYFHVGGDEVEYPCWTQNPAIAAWMSQMGFTSGQQVFNYFEVQLEGILKLPTVNRSMVVWQDAFQAGVTLPAGTIVSHGRIILPYNKL
jgi:hexosaminidase